MAAELLETMGLSEEWRTVGGLSADASDASDAILKLQLEGEGAPESASPQVVHALRLAQAALRTQMRRAETAEASSGGDADAAALRRELAELRTSEAAARAQATAKDEELAAAKEELQQVEDELQQKEEEVTELTSALEAEGGAAPGSRKVAVATGAAADRSRIRMTELEEEVQELQQRNKDLRSEIKMKEEKYDNERERVHELRTQLAADKEERQQLEEEYADRATARIEGAAPGARLSPTPTAHPAPPATTPGTARCATTCAATASASTTRTSRWWRARRATARRRRGCARRRARSTASTTRWAGWAPSCSRARTTPRS